jgi:hypothetical protein
MIFRVKILIRLLNSKTLDFKQISKQLVVILVDFSIPLTCIDINQ